MNVVLVGHVCIDHNVSEQASYTGWGSAVLHMAHWFRGNLEIDPVVVAQYGPDLLPHAAGFRLYPEAPLASQTLYYKNQTTAGRRQQSCGNLAEAGPVAVDGRLAAELAAADIVVVAPLLPNFSPGYVAQLMALVPEDSLRVLLPQGYLREIGPDGAVSRREFAEAQELLRQFELVILSAEDCADWRRAGVTWALAGNAAVVVTQGPDGATILSETEMMQVPTYPLEPAQVVDSVGCGDVFSAALSYHYHTQGSLVGAVAAANQAAHAKLTRVPAAQR